MLHEKKNFLPHFLLLIPMFGMMFSNHFNWSLFDFITMAILLLVLGIGINFILHNIERGSLRSVLIILALLLFSLIYVELSVGVFESPFAGQ